MLKIISRSTFDPQPVLETLVENATRLAGAGGALIARFDGEVFRFLAESGASPEFREFWRRNVIRPGRGSAIGRAAIEHQTVHIVDALADPEWEQHEAQRAGGYRTVLAVPMLRQDELIGLFFMWRTEVRAFTGQQINLVATFADQAAIAIENARLLTELQARNADLTEALEQQTATAEILRVISSSPTDITPVLDTVAENASRLCEAQDATIFRRDGDRLLLVAHHGAIPFGPVGDFSLPLVPGTANGRSVLDARTIHVLDLQTAADEFPEGSETARRFGHRTTLNVPLMREGVAIGSISLRRTEVQPFSERQVALLQTFADQAVIAIENVRLFNELQGKNADLTEALEQQTATSEILRVISRSPTDVQPVFDAIVSSAQTLSVASTVRCSPSRMIASTSPPPTACRRTSCRRGARSTHAPRVRGTVMGRAILERRAVHARDLETDPAYRTAPGRLVGIRAILGVPMLREGQPIGVIGVWRSEVKSFSDKQITLLQIFADQAVIAIENVRLFKELDSRNSELTGRPRTADGDQRAPQGDRPVDLRSPAGLRDAGRERDPAVRGGAGTDLPLRW